MIVTDVSDMPSKRVKITFDDGTDLVVYKGEARKYHLREGETITSEEYEEVYYQVVGKRAKKRAMFLLEKMDRTEYGLRDKLKQNFYPEDLIDDAIAYVKKYHYLDDERYAKNYIHYHQEKKSAGRLKLDLMRKGIPKDMIAQALEEEYEMEEDKLIRELLEKRGYFSSEKDMATQRKNYQFLLRRGFKSSDILRVMKCDDYLT